MELESNYDKACRVSTAFEAWIQANEDRLFREFIEENEAACDPDNYGDAKDVIYMIDKKIEEIKRNERILCK